MKIDFHTHGKLAKKLPFSIGYTQYLFKKAVESQLDAICLTEHFNTISFHEMYETIYNRYKHVGDGILTDEGLFVFFGMEVDILEGGHTLLIGHYHDIIEINQKLENHKDKETFLPFDSLVELIQDYDILFIAAHPYREGGHIPSLTQQQLSYFFALDLNGKDLGIHKKETIDNTFALATQINKPVISGSDTHQEAQYGSVYSEFNDYVTSLKHLKSLILNGDYRIVMSDYISFKVEQATIQKRLLKEIHKLGGDYVNILSQE